MELVLYKKGKAIAKASDKHWWFAIFKLGMFSKPKDLSMDIKITFPNQQMLEAFLESFKKLGYKSKHFRIINNTFCFMYEKPRTRKVWTRTWLTDAIRQFFNRKNVELYNKYLEEFIDNNKIDNSRITNGEKMILINDLLPNLLKNAPENQEQSKQFINSVLNKKYANVVFLNSEVYSELDRANKS